MALFPSAAPTGSTNKPALAFPSFSSSRITTEKQEPAAGLDWLQNESYQEATPPTADQGSCSDDSGPPPSRHKRKKLEHVQKKRRKHHARSPAPSSAPLKPDTIWVEETGLKPEEAFCTDPKPDHSNLHYDSLYSGSVASYRRRFGWHTVGLGPGQELEWSDGRGKLPRKREMQTPRYFQASTAASELVMAALSSSARALTSSTQPEPYLSLVEKEASAMEDEVEEREREGSELLTVEHFLRQRSAEYNRRLLQQPHDISLWLEFITFQDESLQWSKAPGPAIAGDVGGASELTGKTRVACIERKLSIFERALESNPLSVELLVGQMQLAREVWSPERLLRRWKDLVFRQPNQPLLWLSYIEFCRSQFTAYSTPSLSSLYSKALSTLSAVQEGTLRSHHPLPNSAYYLLAVFVLYCHFLSAAGHSERAVALFQALLEFNLACPPGLDTADTSVKERIEFFETFWDSGAARIGEEGAPGWSSWMAATQLGREPLQLSVVDPPERPSEGESEREEVDEEVALVAGHPLSEAWLLLERRRAREEWLPLHGEEDSTDPDRVVLLDDIRPALFRLGDPTLHLTAVLAFLHFLGTPLSSPLTLTPHHVPPCISHLPELSPPPVPFLSSRSHVAMPLWSLRAWHGLRPLPPALSQWAAAGPSPLPRPQVASSFVANVCSQALALLREPRAQTAVSEAWLGFELRTLEEEVLLPGEQQSREGRRRGKALQRLVRSLLQLEAHRNDLRLWNCCALVELWLGGVASAAKLYQRVLSQCHLDGSKEDSSGVVALYRCFVEVTLGLLAPPHLPPSSPSPSLTLHTLVSLAEGTYQAPPPGHTPQVSPARVLKARNSFARAVSEQWADIDRLVCHAYLEYVSRGLKQACSVLDDSLADISGQLSACEGDDRKKTPCLKAMEDLLHVKVRLLTFHSSTHPLPPSLLRSTLELALSRFPDHPGFLAAFIESEQQSFISGRLRRWFDSHAPSSSSPLPWFFAVRAELWRYRRLREMEAAGKGGAGGGESCSEVAAGVIHRVRALLQRATASNNGRHCPLVWRLFVKFEVEQQQLSQAKALFYQAIHHCPGSKVLYADAVEHFPDMVERVCELMEEKEIRVRAPLEEVQLLLSAAAADLKEPSAAREEETSPEADMRQEGGT